jgi:hypothetical protein
LTMGTTDKRLCGEVRAAWQSEDETRCPNHAVPEPYSSCDGTLEMPNV